MRCISKLVLAGAIGAVALGCSDSGQEAPEIGVVSSALTNFEARVVVPAGTDFLTVALGASEAIRLHDGAEVRTPEGGYAKIANTCHVATGVDMHGRVGDIVSVAPVAIHDGARVFGSVTSAGSVTQAGSAQVTGSVVQQASLTPLRTWNATVTFPNTSGPVMVYPGQARTLEPGAYGSTYLYPSGRLSLRTGTYYFDQLDLARDGTFSLDTSAGPILVYVKTAFAWLSRTTSHDPTRLLVGYFGAQPVSIGSSFNGTLLAPDAPIYVHADPAGHSGSVFGKTLEVDAGVHFTFKKFEGWGQVFPPTPRPICVSRYNDQVHAALFAYDNPLSEPTAIERGPRNVVTPQPTVGYEPPTQFLPGSHEYWASYRSGHIIWDIAGARAEADSATSPPCSSDNYAPPPTSALPEGMVDPITAPRPYLSRLSRQLPDRPQFKVFPGAAQPRLGPQPFTVRLTGVYIGGDGFFSDLKVDTRITIDGQTTGRHRVYECDGACVIRNPEPIDESYGVVPENPEAVSVRIEVIEIDNPGRDDHEVDVQFTANARTGESTHPDTCVRHGDNWGICWELVPNEPPTLEQAPEICASWSAQFVDSGFGEDIGNSDEEQDFPAAFARARLYRTDSDDAIWSGFLNENGCVPTNGEGAIEPAQLALPASSDVQLKLRFESAFCKASESATLPAPRTREECTDAADRGWVSWRVWSVSEDTRSVTPDGEVGELDVGDKDRETEDFFGVISREGWRTERGWSIPPEHIDVRDQSGEDDEPSQSDVSRASAISAQVLRMSDSGVVPGVYNVYADDSCPTNQDEIMYDSCAWPAAGNHVFIGPGKLGRNDSRMHQSRWKYIVAHEIGHMVQIAAMGPPGSSDYDFTGCNADNPNAVCFDPPGMDALCRCDQVASANRLHCMQSVERAGAAQIEGFAQFFAAKVWNERDSSACVMNYYKEMALTECRSEECEQYRPEPPSSNEELTRNLPPTPVDCKNPAQWRDRHCGMAEAGWGTELDWMVFLWNLHAVNPVEQRFAMAELFDVYRQGCGGRCSYNQDIDWKFLADASAALYGATSAKHRAFLDAGHAAGVDLDLDVQ